MNLPCCHSRCHWEAKLLALHEYHRQRMIAAPDGIFHTIRPRLQAIRAAFALPESALPLLLSLADRHGRNPTFRAFIFGAEFARKNKPPVVSNNATGGPSK
jgi:hypothetical protein